jgi:hypothetical protein
MRKIAAAVTSLLAASLVVSVPVASATDQQLRDGIKAAEQTVKPDADAWAQAVNAFGQSGDPSSVRPATQKLITDVTNERKLLVAIKPSTAKVRRGKALYLKSLKSFGAGLKAFDKALAKLQSGKKASVKAQLKKFVKEIEKSDAAARKAAKLIGVTS